MKFISAVIFLMMTPLTRPASEFHRTRSPILKSFGIAVTPSSRKPRTFDGRLSPQRPIKHFVGLNAGYTKRCAHVRNPDSSLLRVLIGSMVRAGGKARKSLGTAPGVQAHRPEVDQRGWHRYDLNSFSPGTRATGPAERLHHRSQSATAVVRR